MIRVEFHAFSISLDPRALSLHNAKTFLATNPFDEEAVFNE